MRYKVLIVDPNKDYPKRLITTLNDSGFVTSTVDSGQLVIEQAKNILPHLIILEVEIPEIDGIELCKIVRKTPELLNTIVVFLTNQAEDFVQVAAYKAGCDDYILKTIKPRLLTYRIEALLKRQFEKFRHHTNNEPKPNDETLYIDTERFLIVVGEKEVYLPKKQFLILQYLVSQPSKVFSRNNIYSFIWGQNSKVGVRTIDVYIRKIREQIGVRYIKTIKGVGYRFE